MVSGTIAGPKKSNYFLLAFAVFLATALLTGNTAGSVAQGQQQFPESIIAASSTDTTPHALKLKATQQGEDGQPKRVSGFKIDLTNVVTAQVNSQVLVFVTDNSVQVIGARVRTASDQLIDLVSSTGQTNAFSLAGLPVGVYTLDTITQKGNTRAAYEGILVISQQPTTVINETTRNVINQEINQKTRVDSETFKENDDDDDKNNDDKYKDKNGGNPYCDLVPDSYKGGCHDRKDYHQGGPNDGLYPCRDGSNVGDWRDCKDAGDHPDEKEEEEVEEEEILPPCDNVVAGTHCDDSDDEDSWTDEEVEEEPEEGVYFEDDNGALGDPITNEEDIEDVEETAEEEEESFEDEESFDEEEESFDEEEDEGDSFEIDEGDEAE